MPDLGNLKANLARVPGWAWFVLALVFQLAIIGSLVLTHYTTATAGTPVTLKIAPVDPRDPLRGDYLSFTYDISRVELGRRGAVPPRKGTIVYVPLAREPGGPFWIVNGQVATSLPDSNQRAAYGPDTVFIRGAIAGTSGGKAHVVYGIEEYFVPEGKAATFPIGAKDAAARVVVDPKDGKGQLRQVYVHGRPWP